MSMSDIEKIIAAEAEADKLRSDTSVKINKLLSSAEAEGSEIYNSTVSAAEVSVKAKEKETAGKIAEASEKSAFRAEEKAAEIKSAASVNIDKAARLICERIIKG